MLLQIFGTALILLCSKLIINVHREYYLLKKNKKSRIFMHKHFYGITLFGSFGIYFGLMLLIKHEGVTAGFIELYRIFFKLYLDSSEGFIAGVTWIAKMCYCDGNLPDTASFHICNKLNYAV